MIRLQRRSDVSPKMVLDILLPHHLTSTGALLVTSMEL